ncbi:hypothetical protein LTR86_002158 [Recurvomyces mirabilis]|nr:hypothetical protein LTR86_002158 [Recurvomyces mirabilis]
MTYTPTPSPDNPFHSSKEWIWKGLPPPEANHKTFGSLQTHERPKLKKHNKYTSDQQSSCCDPMLSHLHLPPLPHNGLARRPTINLKPRLPPGKTLGYHGRPFEPVQGDFGFGIYKPSDHSEGEVDFWPMEEEAWHRAIKQAHTFRKDGGEGTRRGSLDLTLPPEPLSRPMLSRGASSDGRLETRLQKPGFVPYRPPLPKVTVPDPIDPAWKKEFEKVKAMDLKSLSKQEKMGHFVEKIIHMLQYLVELPDMPLQAHKYNNELVQIALELGICE